MWRRKNVYRRRVRGNLYRSGILLVTAGCLFFLFPFSKNAALFACPILTYTSGQDKNEDAFFHGIAQGMVPLVDYTSGRNVSVCEATQDPFTARLTVEQIVLLEGQDEEHTDGMTEIGLREEGMQAEGVREETESAAEDIHTSESDDARQTEDRGENARQAEDGRENARQAEDGRENARQSEDGQEDAGQVHKERADTEWADTEQTDVRQTTGNKVKTLDMSQYTDFETLLRDFYVIDKTTYIDASELQVDKMLNEDLTIDKTAEGPQILIYHTHSQEGYADTVPGDASKTVVAAGEELAQILTEEYGFSVLHHTGQYDVESRDYAYANVAPALGQILDENPTIEVVIDLHRDGVPDDTHLVTQIGGKNTATFMFFNGLSRLKNTGEIAYLANENRAGNLAFSFQLQKKCMEYYPGLTRSIYLKGYRYNMQYRKRSLLVELGAQTNTFEEVENALGPLAHVIAMVLSGE